MVPIKMEKPPFPSQNKNNNNNIDDNNNIQ